VSQRTGLGARQQPPLPLIQMREDRLELRRQHLPGFLHGIPYHTRQQRAVIDGSM
jgi:hypothetical protein